MRQVELANKLKVTPAFVNQLILGKRKPERNTLIKIAEALEIPVDDLLPEKVRGGVPLLFEFTGRAFCEYKPEDWKAHRDEVAGHLSLPLDYIAEKAEREKIFSVSIGNNRLYPLLRNRYEDLFKANEGNRIDR